MIMSRAIRQLSTSSIEREKPLVSIPTPFSNRAIPMMNLILRVQRLGPSPLKSGRVQLDNLVVSPSLRKAKPMPNLTRLFRIISFLIKARFAKGEQNFPSNLSIIKLLRKLGVHLD
jgi:hypothetical protein